MTNAFSSGSLARTLALALALALGGSACNAPAEGNDIAKNDFTQFRAEVYPVLLRDCAFHACHGGEDRFFRVWGPGRVRVDPLARAFSQVTGEEIGTNHLLALSMIDAKHPSRSLLLRKPLAVEAGGSGHLGVDKYGRNVYRTVNDPGYVAIKKWVMATSATAAAPPMVPTPVVPAQ